MSSSSVLLLYAVIFTKSCDNMCSGGSFASRRRGMKGDTPGRLTAQESTERKGFIEYFSYYLGGQVVVRSPTTCEA